MNALLSSFLDTMVEEYRCEHVPAISQVIEKMIVVSDGNIRDSLSLVYTSINIASLHHDGTIASVDFFSN